MNKQIVTLLVLLALGQNSSPSENADDSKDSEDMDIKIKRIARGIVDKWVAEGLTVTKEKVEGWIDILDKSQGGRKNDKENSIVQTKITENINNQRKILEQSSKAEDFGDEFKQVRDTLVTTFTNIGHAKCEKCKKNGKENTKNENQNLENMSVEKLMQKQEMIKKFMQMEKLSKLAKVAEGFSQLSQLKDIVKNLNTVYIPREEL